MITVAIIEKNRCSFDDIEKYMSPLLYRSISKDERLKLKKELDNYIWSIINPYVKIIETNKENLLEDSLRAITSNFPDKRIDGDFYFHTESSYSFPKRCLEILYFEPLWDNYKKFQLDNMNNLGCYFSLNHNVIENSCAILSNIYDMDADKNVVIGSTTKEDIIRVIKKRYMFSAILIKNDTIEKYYYQNPKYLICEIFGLTESDNINKISVELFGYKLTFYSIYDKNNYVNKIATRMNGSFRLYGNVLVIHELDDNINGNICEHEFKRLNVLSYGRKYDRESYKLESMKEEQIMIDENGNQSTKEIIPYRGRYVVVEEKMQKWKLAKNKCVNCGINIDKPKKPIICDKCFRVKYCSETCKKEFDRYHYEECINYKTMME